MAAAAPRASGMTLDGERRSDCPPLPTCTATAMDDGMSLSQGRASQKTTYAGVLNVYLYVRTQDQIAAVRYRRSRSEGSCDSPIMRGRRISPSVAAAYA